MRLQLIVLGLASVVNLTLGLVVLTRTYQKAYGWFFALTIFGVVLWGLGDIIMLSAKDPGLLRAGAKLFYIAPVAIPVGVLLFALSFPENKRVARPIIICGSLAFAVWTAGLLANLDFLVASIEVREPLNIATPKAGAFLAYTIHFAAFFLTTYYVLFKKFRETPRSTRRSQIGYTFFGIITASVLAMITNLLFPSISIRNLVWLGPILTIIFVVAASVAIIRHGLFDIRLVVVRSLAYVLSLGLLTAIYGSLATFLSAVIARTTDSTVIQTLITAVLLATTAVSYGPVKRYFDRVTNKLFYRDAYDPQVFLDQLNGVLVSTVEIVALLKQTAAIIQDNMRLDFVLFNLKETDNQAQRVIGTERRKFEKQDVDFVRQYMVHIQRKVIITDYLEDDKLDLAEVLRQNNIAVLGRLTSDISRDREGIGYLVLGPKRSGNPYNKQDIRVLEIIVNELVIAIQNALRFEEIENFNITLQGRVEDATRRLRQTNEKLRQLDETKDEFISMASHQLRTPLTSMKGYVSMVLEGDAGKITGMQRKLLDQAFVSSQRMVYLIADLLNVSRLKTGRFVIEAVPSNLADVIEGEISQLKETAKGRNLTLTYIKPANFPALMLDETKIRQVIMNFVDNAIYYTPSGGHITVTLEDTGDVVEYKVTDDGIGVPKHEQHHLFSKFFRAGNARKIRPDGTGLGLFMAKKVIVAQGGSVIFDSQEGKGSTFGFSFAKNKLNKPA